MPTQSDTYRYFRIDGNILIVKSATLLDSLTAVGREIERLKQELEKKDGH